MAGCIISPLDFNMAMEVIPASKGVAGAERLKDCTWLPPFRAHMDDMRSLTTARRTWCIYRFLQTITCSVYKCKQCVMYVQFIHGDILVI